MKRELKPLTGREEITDISGAVIGRLRVIEPAGKLTFRRGMAVYFRCVCECGREVLAQRSNLLAGRKTSCGCDKTRKWTAQRGASDHPLYDLWVSVHYRCSSPKQRSFADYGARGITVCDRWTVGEGNLTGFECFALDMGDKPTAESMIERRHNDDGYSPENCVWADRVTQNSNKRSNVFITAHGKTQTVAAWARETGISEFTIYRRVKRGWSDGAALKPVR